MEKINEAVGMNNCITMSRVWKRILLPLRRQDLWKCIGCVLSAVTYGNKGHTIWS